MTEGVTWHLAGEPTHGAAMPDAPRDDTPDHEPDVPEDRAPDQRPHADDDLPPAPTPPGD